MDISPELLLLSVWFYLIVPFLILPYAFFANIKFYRNNVLKKGLYTLVSVVIVFIIHFMCFVIFTGGSYLFFQPGRSMIFYAVCASFLLSVFINFFFVKKFMSGLKTMETSVPDIIHDDANRQERVA